MTKNGNWYPDDLHTYNNTAMSKNNNNSNAIGFSGLLTIAFIVLKLTNYITWSWWWVTAPIWAPVALVVVGFIIYMVISTVFSKS